MTGGEGAGHAQQLVLEGFSVTRKPLDQRSVQSVWPAQ